MSINVCELKSCLNYNPIDGAFVWLVDRGKAKTGHVAGCLRPDGYRYVSVSGRRFLAHRLAFLFMTGSMPKMDVDHINGDRSDNRWANLRDVPAQLNRQNQHKPKAGSASNLLGAYFDARCGRWYSNIRANGKRVPLGRFDTAEQAHAAYISAKRVMHEACSI